MGDRCGHSAGYFSFQHPKPISEVLLIEQIAGVFHAERGFNVFSPDPVTLGIPEWNAPQVFHPGLHLTLDCNAALRGSNRFTQPAAADDHPVRGCTYRVHQFIQ